MRGPRRQLAILINRESNDACVNCSETNHVPLWLAQPGLQLRMPQSAPAPRPRDRRRTLEKKEKKKKKGMQGWMNDGRGDKGWTSA
jgi:hypothetical protein